MRSEYRGTEKKLSRRLTIVVLALVFVLATPVHFVAQTLLADEFSASVLAAVVAVAVFVLVTLMSGLPKLDELRALTRSDLALVCLAGLLGVFGTQYLVLSHRFTDAPPGAEVIFFTTAVWGVIAAIAGYATRRKPLGIQIVAAFVALTGSAAVLANWERPSSFSPFVRYPREDVAMLLAGLAWAAFGVIIARLATRHRWRALLPLACAPSAVVALAVALVTPGNVSAFQRISALWPLLLILCSAFTAMVVSWAWLSALVGVTRASSLLFIAPVSLTLLGIVERRVGSAGPSPLLWNAVTWGCIVTFVGAVGIGLLDRRWVNAPGLRLSLASPPGSRSRRVLALVGLALGVLATVAGVIALAAPALVARVVGTRIGGAAYEAAWTLPGAETIAGWLVFLSGLALLLAGLANTRLLWRAVATVAIAVGVAIVILSVPALDTTPLRTWTRWIPAEVQQDYGTEYASLTLADEPRSALTTGAWIGLAGAVVFVVFGLAGMARRPATGPPAPRATESAARRSEDDLETVE